MQIKLKWTNRNNRPVSTKIYRTEAIVPNDQLGAPLVTLDGTILEWVDTTAVYGKTYYYVFGVVGGPTELFSMPLKVEAIYSTGPGPNKLISGDQQLGYFGHVNALDFFTTSEFFKAVGAPGFSENIALPVWDKWYRNGKILFVPRLPLTTSVAWNSIYGFGCVFGTNDDGPWRPAGTPAKNQMNIIDKGFNRFIVRLLTAADDRNNPQRTVPDGATRAVRRYSEVSDLVYTLANNIFPPSQRYPRVSQSTTTASSLVAGARSLICQEKYLTGALGGNSTDTNTGGGFETLVAIAPNVGYSWKPVLELIQSDFVIEETVL